MPALNLNGCCCDMANQIATFTASLEDGAPTKRKQPKQHGTSQSHASLKGHTSHAMHRSSRRQSRRQSSGPTGDVLRMWSPSGLPKPTGNDCIARSQLPREREREVSATGLSYISVTDESMCMEILCRGSPQTSRRPKHQLPAA